jgi:hypothetical protein
MATGQESDQPMVPLVFNLTIMALSHIIRVVLSIDLILMDRQIIIPVMIRQSLLQHQHVITLRHYDVTDPEPISLMITDKLFVVRQEHDIVVMLVEIVGNVVGITEIVKSVRLVVDQNDEPVIKLVDEVLEPERELLLNSLNEAIAVLL